MTTNDVPDNSDETFVGRVSFDLNTHPSCERLRPMKVNTQVYVPSVRRHPRAGSILVMSAIMMTMVFGLVALGIDFGLICLWKTK